MSKKREELLEQIWAAQDTAYDLMREYDSLPHSYGENVLYQAEAHLIDRIALHPGVTVTDLANMVRKTPSACSQLVRRLRDKGWVEQVRNTANNRQVMLRLTPAGEHVYRDHAAFDKQCQALTFRRLEGFTEAELAAYLGDKLSRCEVVLEEPADIAQAWAFVTCSYQTSNSRTVVYAKEVEGWDSRPSE